MHAEILTDLDNRLALSTEPAESPLCFSITTEGPIHELWVHFKLGDAIYMYNIGTWRTTHARHVRELVYCLTRILTWAKDEFMERIREKLDAVLV